jgi:putative MFS transporter
MATQLSQLSDPDESSAIGRLPWALRRLGAPASLTRHQRHVLRVVGVASLFANYGLGVMGLALPQIQAGLHVAEAEVGGVTALVQLGMIPALLLTVLADHFGRRRLLLITILGFSLCAVLTAFVRTADEFVVAQFLARVFIASNTMLAVVVIAEEFTADTRGWGIGMVGALGALGHGLASIVFSGVNVLPYGWRALYAFGVLPLLLLPRFRRTLRETPRFARHHEAHQYTTGLWASLEPLRSVARMYPGRMVALCAALFPSALIFETATIFQAKFLQEAHHYAPATVALLYLSIGALVPLGNIAGGALGDRFGRKRVMIAALIANAAAIALFYNTGGPLVPVAWGLMMLSLAVVLVLFSALGSELFPTSYRSTASGVRSTMATLGAAAGLWAEGKLYVLTGSHAAAITCMLIVAPIAPLIIALGLPETASRELEEVSPERDPGSSVDLM